MPLGYCQEANCIFIKNSTRKSRCCLFWRRVWDSPVCGRSGAAEKQSTGLFFNTRPSNPFYTSQKQTAPAKADAVYFGGGCGIRTHVGLLPNGFQDRLVMTASITLRVYVQVQLNLTFLIQFSRLRLVMSCCGARNFLFAIAHKIPTAATPSASLALPPAALGNVPTSIFLRIFHLDYLITRQRVCQVFPVYL